jgi:hypothetical protein
VGHLGFQQLWAFDVPAYDAKVRGGWPQSHTDLRVLEACGSTLTLLFVPRYAANLPPQSMSQDDGKAMSQGKRTVVLFDPAQKAIPVTKLHVSACITLWACL